MRFPQSPLSEAETQELTQLLEQHAPRQLEYARGVLTAVLTAPTTPEPSQFLALVLGSEFPDQETLSRALELLMREYNAIADCLSLGVPAVPAPEDSEAIEQFARGYVRWGQGDEKWKGDDEAFALLVPLIILSKYVDEQRFPMLAPEFEEDPEGWKQQAREQLADTVMALHAHFEDAREKPANMAKADKTGRNEPCPCGSGKKYKKCCGAPN